MGIDSFGSNKWTESCLEKGRMGLLQFKTSVQSINEDANWLLPSWVNDPRSDCCGWERVICNSTTRRITQLSLNNIRHVEYYTKLLGYALMNAWFLNVSLFIPFEELVSLDLSENWFKGCLENEGILSLLFSYYVIHEFYIFHLCLLSSSEKKKKKQ